MQNRYFVTRDKHFTEESRIPVFRDATWQSWMSGHRRFERIHCLHFQILDTALRIKAVCSEIALRYKSEGRGFDFPMVSLEFFIDNPSGRTMTLGYTHPLREMSTRNISWG